MSENEAKKWPQYLAAISICLGAVGTGTALGWSSNILEDLEDGKLNDFKMSREEISWATSMMPLGAMVVCLPIGFVANTIGRKPTVLLTVFPLVLGWLLIMFSQNMTMIYVGRFLTGVAGGTFSVIAPLYISEISEAEIRGRLGTFFYLFEAIGILYAGIFGHATSMLVYHCLLLVIPTIFGIAFLFETETPVYLIRKGKLNKLPRAYKMLRGKKYDPSGEIDATKEDIAKERPKFWKVMKTKAAKKATLLCFTLMFCQQLSGITIIIFYLRDITFIDDEWYPEWSVIGLGIVQVFFSMITSEEIMESGSQTLLTDSSLSMAIGSAMVGMFYSLRDNGTYSFDRLACLAEVFLAFYLAGFTFGMGAIPWMAPFELFPPEVKVACGSAAATFNWLLAFLLTKFYFSLATAIGHAAIFYVITGVAIIESCILECIFPDTNGKTFAEIQAELEATNDNQQ